MPPWRVQWGPEQADPVRKYGDTGAIGTGSRGLSRTNRGRILGTSVDIRGRTLGAIGQRDGLRALARRPLVIIFVALGTVESARVLIDRRPLDLLILGLIGLLALAVVRERDEIAGDDSIRRTEAESFARILRGLARSVSPDAIVDAIAEELGAGTGADHVVVVRRRPETHNLEAILSSSRAGAPASRTSLPLSVLEDPAEADALAQLAIAASRGRRLTAVPIVPDPDGDPQLVPLGIAAGRPGGRPRGRAGDGR